MQNSHEKARQTWILVLASLASFMVSLDALVVVTALTTIHQDLGVSIEALEWTLNAYTLSFAVLLIPAAALGDRFGRRRMFVAGLLLFVGASAACALAHNIGWLIAARTIQGCGAALVLPLALTLLSAAFPPEQRARALGIFGSIMGLALIAGPVVGGSIAQGLAVDLLAQRAYRPADCRARAQSRTAKLRATHFARSRRPAERFGRLPRAGMGTGAREQRRLGQL